ncbi:MAG: 3-phosphoshikimate 1-carboxyvinyltransferase [Firmicutes bacterium]|nr:3-phosphoshikimate 1-carboxyvinyltransferase [Bacillota bacterium]
MELRVIPGEKISGSCTVPGDKSISHRAALIGALAEGTTTIKNFQRGADCLSTLRCLRALGVKVEEEEGVVRVTGKGLNGLEEPEVVLDAGNSGTTMRLLLGVLAGQDLFAVITGDESLRRRPMGRVVQPLQKMGAQIWGRAGGSRAPLAIKGFPRLAPLAYRLPVASAQVKSAILLAGLNAEGTTTVIQPALSRDHTERMLRAFGASLEVRNLTVQIQGKKTRLQGREIDVPGDLSSAAFLLVAASILPESELFIRNVGINPTRAGILEALERMGAKIFVANERVQGGEPVADLQVQFSPLKGVEIKGDLIPRVIDEIPILAVAAAAAEGVTEISDAAELRVKETDRLRAITTELQKMGVDIQEKPDGLLIRGGRALRGASVSSWGDHRIAMALAVAGLIGTGPTTVRDVQCIDVSFPGFAALLASLGARLNLVRTKNL